MFYYVICFGLFMPSLYEPKSIAKSNHSPLGKGLGENPLSVVITPSPCGRVGEGSVEGWGGVR